MGYADDCLRIASTWECSGRVALEALTEKDILTRAAMATHIRAGVSQGEALKRARIEHSVEWKTKPHGRQDGPDTGNSTGQGGRKRRNQGNQADSSGQKGKGQDQKGAGKGKFNLVRQYNGKPICKPYNDGRGCARTCPQGHAHVCDVEVNGKACGFSNHCRTTHRGR